MRRSHLRPALTALTITFAVIQTTSHIPPALAASLNPSCPAPTISIDVESIDGPEWRPELSLRGDSLVLSEVVIYVAKRLATATTARFYGLDDVFEVIDAKRSTASVLSATHYLHAEVDDDRLAITITSIDDRCETFPTVLALAGPLTSVHILNATRSVLRTANIGLHDNDVFANQFSRVPASSHLSTAQARFLRILGRRYGAGTEAELLREARAYVDDAHVSLDTAHVSTVIERVAILNRLYNLDPTDKDLLLSGTALLDRFARAGENQPEYAFYSGLFEYWRTHDTNSLIRQLRKAIDLDSRFADAYFVLGVLGVDSGTTLSKAIALNPAMLRAQSYLARSYATNDPQRARALFQELLSIREYGLGLYHKTIFEIQQCDADKASDSIERMKATGEFYGTDTDRLSAFIELRRGNYARAERALVTALKTDAEIKKRYLAIDLSDGVAQAGNSALVDLQRVIRTQVEQHGRLELEDEILLALISGRLENKSDAIGFAKSLGLRFPGQDEALAAQALVYHFHGNDTLARAIANDIWSAVSDCRATDGTGE